MNNKRGLIFDIGGILVRDPWEWMLFESPHSIADQFHIDKESIKKAGYDTWKMFDTNKAHNPPQELGYAFWKSFLMHLNDVPQTLSLKFLIDYADKSIETLHNDSFKEMLGKLKTRNIPLAICSNNTDYWFHLEWEALGVQEFFKKENIILSHNVGATKGSSKNEMFNAVRKNIALPFDELVFIDDRKHNIEKAESLGITSIHATDQTADTLNYIENQIKHYFDI